MTKFSKTEESYIEHEVQLRLHDEKFKINDNKFQSLEAAIHRLDDKMDTGLKHIENKLDSSIKHLDNKFMLMFSLILGSILLPQILHYLNLVK
jgi:hypothetical protein